MRNYGLIMYEDAETLVNEVNNAVDKGYAPTGGIQFDGVRYLQAMFKKPAVKSQAKARKRKLSLEEQYTPQFEQAWGLYPKRSGSNPKKRAWKAWVARIREADRNGDRTDMTNGVVRYAAYIKATNTEPQFIMMTATFFGPDKHYENPWLLPEAESTLPKNDAKLEAYAKSNGLSMPRPGEESHEYRARLAGES